MAVHGLNQLVELGAVLFVLAKADNVHGNVVFLQLFCKLYKRLFRVGYRRTDKRNNALALVLVLAVLEGQLRDIDTCGEADAAR